MEVCPSCGQFVTVLNETTGWCFECSPRICYLCGGNPQPDHRYNGYTEAHGTEVIYRNGRNTCKRCIRIQWVSEHADSIEKYMSEGMNYTEACETVSADNRAICIICSSPIQGRHKSRTLFCTKTERCKKAKSKYTRLIERQRLRRDEALERVLIEFIEQEREVA